MGKNDVFRGKIYLLFKDKKGLFWAKNGRSGHITTLRTKKIAVNHLYSRTYKKGSLNVQKCTVLRGAQNLS